MLSYRLSRIADARETVTHCTKSDVVMVGVLSRFFTFIVEVTAG